MITAGLAFAALAALLHVYIFTMESLTWTSPRTRATFGTTPEEAETTKLNRLLGLPILKASALEFWNCREFHDTFITFSFVCFGNSLPSHLF